MMLSGTIWFVWGSLHLCSTWLPLETIHIPGFFPLDNGSKTSLVVALVSALRGVLML